MDLFRSWLVVLVVFEIVPLAQLLCGRRVHEMAPAMFPYPESEEFHVWYGFVLASLTSLRLLLAFDINNVGLLRANAIVHVLEVILFMSLGRRLFHRVSSGSVRSLNQEETDVTDKPAAVA
ncbi:hypothetical protein DIPPA_23995 [Diplonema papillatum]|nr:hypothetical protein DIPPA_23995 [Diplonema papillatum]